MALLRSRTVLGSAFRRLLIALLLAHAGSCSFGVAQEDEYFAASVKKIGCEGHCGKASVVPGSEPECFCDPECVEVDDCCEDYALVCKSDASVPGDGGAGSCLGYCGYEDEVPGSSPGCFCDDACIDSDDCCLDYLAVCADAG
jgi:hypothetical protein